MTDRGPGRGGNAPLGGELIRRAQRGDTFALDAILRRLAPYLGRICGAIALDQGDDALQETMLAIVRNLGSLRQPEALRGWARRIAVREAMRVAWGGRSVPIDPAMLAVKAQVSDDATAVEVHSVLATLPPEQRAVLVLRHIDDLGEKEMAATLGIAVGTVKSRLHR